MVAATLASMSAADGDDDRVEEVEEDLFFTLVMIEEATALVISAHDVVLTVSVGLKKQESVASSLNQL